MKGKCIAIIQKQVIMKIWKNPIEWFWQVLTQVSLADSHRISKLDNIYGVEDGQYGWRWYSWDGDMDEYMDVVQMWMGWWMWMWVGYEQGVGDIAYFLKWEVGLEIWVTITFTNYDWFSLVIGKINLESFINGLSAACRCILVLFEWYGCPKKRAQKGSCNTFFIYISHKN